jgi:hypothetical protein
MVLASAEVQLYLAHTLCWLAAMVLHTQCVDVAGDLV